MEDEREVKVAEFVPGRYMRPRGLSLPVGCICVQERVSVSECCCRVLPGCESLLREQRGVGAVLKTPLEAPAYLCCLCKETGTGSSGLWDIWLDQCSCLGQQFLSS